MLSFSSSVRIQPVFDLVDACGMASGAPVFSVRHMHGLLQSETFPVCVRSGIVRSYVELVLEFAQTPVDL